MISKKLIQSVMKSMLALSAIIVLSCNNLLAQNKKSKKQIVKTTMNSPFVSLKTKQLIQDTLYKSYLNKYQNEMNMYEDAAKIITDTVEGSIQIKYVNKDNEPAFAPIHQIPSIHNFIEGDLNKDGLNDLIVSVYYNQGSRPRLNIYCYITQNKKLAFYKLYSIHDLGICTNEKDNVGRFFPNKIENGLLVGQTDCLQAGDPGCCPSLEMITYFKFDKGFKLVKQEKKKSN